MKELTDLAEAEHEQPFRVRHGQAGEGDGDLYTWHVEMRGPPHTPYSGGTFRLRVNFPPDYPFKPPTVAFVTHIVHPNVSFWLTSDQLVAGSAALLQVATAGGERVVPRGHMGNGRVNYKTAQQERQDKFEKMERALALVHLERERRGMEGQPTSTSAPAGRAEGATPARAHPGPRSSACSGICTPESSQPSRPWQPSRDWQKPLLSPAAERKVDMLDRLEQRPTSANLPGPPRTPGLFFGFKR